MTRFHPSTLPLPSSSFPAILASSSFPRHPPPIFAPCAHKLHPSLKLHRQFGSPTFVSVLSTKTKRSLPSLITAHSSTEPHPQDHSAPALQGNWEDFLATATSLYPLYVVAGGFLAVVNPSAFAWFVKRGPTSYSIALGSIMLAMGLSLRLEDLLNVILKRPLAVLFGFAAQYLIMPALGAGVSQALHLPSALSVGVILVACCPGGTASNVVTYIARGDVPLSVVMTICTTFGAVFATPLLTQFFAGAYVPVNAAGLAFSTLQVVLAPVVLGAWLQSAFPKAIARIVPFSPLAAVLISSLLACSVFSANVGLLAAVVDATSSLSVSALSNSSLGLVAQAVFLLHAGGFFLGYLAAALTGFSESQRRAVSIEVGMQNSSLGVVLATTHFSSPLVAVPAAVSAVLMNVMGSGLAVVWRHLGRGHLFKAGIDTGYNKHNEEDSS